jgi:copper chaperone CopZ
MSTIAFQVQDMSCGHCVKSITAAVKAADPEAYVRVDLAARRVEVDAAAADAAALRAAIQEAGFTPEPA